MAASFDTSRLAIMLESLRAKTVEQGCTEQEAAAIVAGIVSMAGLGNYTNFSHTDAALDLRTCWLPVILCGVASGLMGGLFARIC